MYKRMMKREAGDAESSSRDAWAFIAAGIQGSRRQQKHVPLKVFA